MARCSLFCAESSVKPQANKQTNKGSTNSRSTFVLLLVKYSAQRMLPVALACDTFIELFKSIILIQFLFFIILLCLCLFVLVAGICSGRSAQIEHQLLALEPQCNETV